MNTENKLTMIPIDKLFPHPDNPRKDLGDVTELAESIKHSGIMQNLTVVPHEGRYRVIIGHRRLAAAKAAGLAELPCLVTQMSYKEQLSTMLAENMQRVDLTVTEQVQGIQQLLDLGDTVDEISKKTGFSKTTVKSRSKLSTLPAEKMREAEKRGATIEEYVKITQIEDEEERKTLLENAGTRDFDWNFKNSVQRQEKKKYLPLMRAEAKKIAEEMKNGNDRWNGKSERIGCINVDDFKSKGADAFEPFKNKQNILWFEDYDGISFYAKVKKKKAEPLKKSDKEIAADKARARLAKPTKTAFELRKAFLEEFNAFTPQNEKIIDEAIMLLSAHKVVSFNSSNFEFLKECVKPFKKNDGYTATILDVRAWFYDNKKKAKFQLLLTLFYDDENNGFYIRNYGENMPKYNNNYSLQFEYNVLAELGYIISTEEMQLMNGTHEAFKGGEKE